jgi:signal transduction histidine kinase
MRSPSLVRRSVRRFVVGGAVLVVAVWLSGTGVERRLLGPDEASARLRVEQAVAATVASVEQRLQRTIDLVQLDAELVRRAEVGDVAAQRGLFDRLNRAVGPDAPDTSATLYGVTHSPIAWVGRPAELPGPRIAGAEAVFLAPGSSGLRLVRVHPLDDPAEAGRRVGTLATESLLAMAAEPGAPEGYVLATDLVSVAVRPHFEGGVDAGPDEFLVRSADGGILAAVSVPVSSLRERRQALRNRTLGVMLGVLAAILLLATGPLLDWRWRQRSLPAGVLTTVAAGGLITLAWVFGVQAIRASGLAGERLLATSHPVAGVVFASSAEFLLASLVAAAWVGLVASGLDHWRLRRRGHGVTTVDTALRILLFLACQVGAALLVAALVVGYGAFLRFGVAAVPADILHFGLRPLDWNRLAIVTGLVVLNAAIVALGVVAFRLALSPWAIAAAPRTLRVLTPAIWIGVPAATVALGLAEAWAPQVPTLIALIVIAVTAWRFRHLATRVRQASQAARLVGFVLALVLPSVAFYPAIVDAAGRARRALIETRLAPEVLAQRRTLQARLADALEDVERIDGLADLVRAADPPAEGPPPTDAAFLVWSQTALAADRLTSSVELYNTAGALVSRFSLKLPDISGAPVAVEGACEWDVFEEVSPFFAEERRLLHAGRGICVPGPGGRSRLVGAIVVHVMLDYGNLSFVSAQSPYLALLRAGSTPGPPPPRVPVNFAVYGWSGRALYASTPTASPLAEEAFRRAAEGRDAFWTMLDQGGRAAEAYVLNDRGGIYVLSAWTQTPVGHLIALAELVALVFLTFLCAAAGGAVYSMVAQRTPASGRALLREVRASFYRKLFLAFVAAALVPVVALAIAARTYFAAVMFADIEMEATRTAAVASRVVEDFGSLQIRGLAALPTIDDNIVVWLSRVIAQDVNIFDGPALLASSERNLFASGLLPTRTPSDAFRAILLDGRPSFVGRESVGGVPLLVAAAPVRIQAQPAILMVPLTSRQQEIEAQVEELDRRVLLGALLFIMLGAGIGYSMAERIADPVNRLMRATRRIARGDLDARVLATSSDELRRLVEAFNGMAEDLRRQRAELERTNRLAAWADMARQVAHDIKNPLTPIQLNAEHLLRVHADRHRPLGALVDECVANILGQVRLLRQIAAEFSSFASSPEPRPRIVGVGPLVRDIVQPYTAGLAGRVTFALEIPDGLPAAHVDPVLIGRALTNVIENALHAMPAGGTVRISAAPDPGGTEVIVRVADTGVGMDAAALERIFEPYFSTKASGTGLGLTIAKRNVEVNGGRVSVTSEPGVGTTVTLVLPIPSAQSAVVPRTQ